MVSELKLFLQKIEKIDDAAELRHLLAVLKGENIELKNREAELLKDDLEMSEQYRQMEMELSGLRKENTELKKQLAKASDQNALKANKIFGRQTEKMDDLVGSRDSKEPADPLSEEASPEKELPEAEGIPKEKKRKKGGKRKTGTHKRNLARLPHREVYEYSKAELDRIYGKGNWRIVSWHKTSKIEHIPAIYYVKVIYTPVLSVGLEHKMACIPPADILLPGSDATSSLVASVMEDKFTMGLPLYRQEARYTRRGIALSRQVMDNWVIRFSTESFEKVYTHLAKLLKAIGCTQSDETTILVIHDGRKAGRKSYMWVHITSELVDDHPIAVFCYEPDRSTDHLRKFYNDYIGEIICDAYSAYKVFEAENGDKIIICGCWMHARRRWADALRVRDAAGLTREQVDEMPEAKALRLIGEIYKEEGKLKGLPADKRLAGRTEHVKAKVDAYFSFVEGLDLGDPSVSERMKDACSYSVNQKEYLYRFLENGKVPIDNGATLYSGYFYPHLLSRYA